MLLCRSYGITQPLFVKISLSSSPHIPYKYAEMEAPLHAKSKVMVLLHAPEMPGSIDINTPNTRESSFGGWKSRAAALTIYFVLWYSVRRPRIRPT